MLKLVFLGTGGAVPSKTRGLPSIAIQYEGKILLFDVGEGTQRAMLNVGLSIMKISQIFITHLHGDHIMGLPGLLQTMTLYGRKKLLCVYGPRGLIEFIRCIRGSVRFGVNFPLEVIEIKDGIIYEDEKFYIEAAEVMHSIPCFAYAFIERDRPGKFVVEKALRLGIPKGPLWKKLQMGEEVTLDNGRVIKPSDVLESRRRGRKIVYSGDTSPCRALTKLAYMADVLIHDSTFSCELADKAAIEGHSTARDAAQTALDAKVKKLYLFHISQRYSDESILLKEAREVFPESYIPSDLQVEVIPLRK